VELDEIFEGVWALRPVIRHTKMVGKVGAESAGYVGTKVRVYIDGSFTSKSVTTGGILPPAVRVPRPSERGHYCSDARARMRRVIWKLLIGNS
jgi:hypothetical protein